MARDCLEVLNDFRVSNGRHDRIPSDRLASNGKEWIFRRPAGGRDSE